MHFLPQPQDVERGIVVTMKTRPALWTGVPANRESLRHHDATARTHLAGERWVYRLHSLPGACSLESEDGQERTPPCVRNGLGEVVVPHPVGDPPVFMVDDIVRLDQRTRFLVVEVAALAGDVLMCLSQEGHCVASPMAPQAAPRGVDTLPDRLGRAGSNSA